MGRAERKALSFWNISGGWEYTDTSRFSEKIVDIWTESWMFETRWWKISRITGMPKYVGIFSSPLQHGLSFKGNALKSKRNSKMWWNRTQNIYIWIFMVLCTYGSFSLSHLLAFKSFLGPCFPPKCITEGSFELGRGGVCEKSGYEICLSTPILNWIFCVFSSWNNLWAQTLSQLCILFCGWWWKGISLF